MKTTNRRMMIPLLLLVAGAAHADAELQSFVDRTLTDARTRAELPAVAALVQVDGRIEAESAVGVRAAGHPEPVTRQDLWHLGSDSKAMTATLIARLVEQGYLKYEDTMARIFPGIAARMSPAMHDVTVAQLLTHTSGLPTLATPEQMPAFEAVIRAERGLRAQRAALVVHYLSRKPASRVGEFSYSNIGYTIAGAVAEECTGRSWEDLVRSEVWRPLGIRSGGFGPPGKSGRFDQPLGHEMKDGKWVSMDPEARASDNPPAIGPAGTVHMTLRDWMLFAQDQLDGELGRGKLLKPESYRRLHTPATRNYAMGWGVVRAADGSNTVLTHTGSNGYWIADVRIFPKRNLVLLVTTNAGGEVAEKADKDIARALQDRLKALD
jgi:CubicO group peptidase (beta-lactamase class C family)